MNRNICKNTFGYARQAKIQIRLRIRAVLSESSLGAFLIAKWTQFFMHTSAKALFSLRGRTGRSHMSKGTFPDVAARKDTEIMDTDHYGNCGNFYQWQDYYEKSTTDSHTTQKYNRLLKNIKTSSPKTHLIAVNPRYNDSICSQRCCY